MPRRDAAGETGPPLAAAGRHTLTEQPGAREKISGAALYALAVLTLVYVLNFLDRTLIYVLFAPIKAEMRFSDLQLALLGTTSFVIFYTLLGVPFGRLADRTVRKNLIAAGLAANSLSIWGATYFFRVHGLSLALIGTVGGVLSLAAGVPGTILGGALADRFGRPHGPRLHRHHQLLGRRRQHFGPRRHGRGPKGLPIAVKSHAEREQAKEEGL